MCKSAITLAIRGRLCQLIYIASTSPGRFATGSEVMLSVSRIVKEGTALVLRIANMERRVVENVLGLERWLLIWMVTMPTSQLQQDEERLKVPC